MSTDYTLSLKKGSKTIMRSLSSNKLKLILFKSCTTT